MPIEEADLEKIFSERARYAGLLRSRGCEEDFVDDLFMETVESIWKKAPSIRKEESENYLIRALKNRFVDLKRKRFFKEKVSSPIPFETPDEPATLGQTFECVSYNDLLSLCESSLTGRLKTVFKKYFLEGFSSCHIAKSLGFSGPVILDDIKKIRRILVKKLEKKHPEV